MKRETITVGHGWNEDYYLADEADAVIAELVELLEEVLDKGRITWQRKVEDAINKHKQG